MGQVLLELLGGRVPRGGDGGGGSRDQFPDGEAGRELELQDGAAGEAGEVGGVVEGVAAQEAEDHHLPFGVAQLRHRGHRVGGAAGGARPSALDDGVAGHGGEPGGGLGVGDMGDGEPAEGAVEDRGRQRGRLGRVGGPGQEVAVDAVDLAVVELGERLPVAVGGALEQGVLARDLGGHVVVAAGAGGRLGVRRTVGWRGQAGGRGLGDGGSAAEQELYRRRQHDQHEQSGQDDGGAGSHAGADSTRFACSRECARGPRPWPGGSWRCRGSRGGPRGGPAGRRPRCARRARG